MINMQRKLGKTEGELAALKASKPKGFWVVEGNSVWQAWNEDHSIE